MAVSVLTDCKIWMSAFDVSGDHNKIAVAYSSDVKDITKFGDSTRSHMGGLRGAGVSGGGHWQAGTSGIDTILQARIGTSPAITISPTTGADGEPAYFMSALLAKYQIGAQVGDVHPFGLNASAASQLVRGTIMHNATRTATGGATARQLGAVSASQRLYASLHVTAVSGTSPSLTASIASDDNLAMTSDTERLTFAAVTAVGSEFASVAGPITDDYWRVNTLISGTSPSFTFVVAVGII